MKRNDFVKLLIEIDTCSHTSTIAKLNDNTPMAKKYEDKVNIATIELVTWYDSVSLAIKEMLEYRKNNTLNFQLEKLDDFLSILEGLKK